MRSIPLLVVSALLSAAVPLAAQDSDIQSRSDAVCERGRISEIFIDNRAVFDTNNPELNERFDWVYGLANALHVRTNKDVIRRELVFSVGDCYDPFLLEESARLLRGMSFLSGVDVFGVRQPDGTWHVIVETRDEWSTRVNVQVTFEGKLRFEGIELLEANLFGTGRSIGVFYEQDEVTRNYGVSYATPQFLGSRWDVGLSVGRSRAGTFVAEEVAYPFVGEIGRWAAHQSFVRRDRFFDYITPRSGGPTAHPLLAVREQSFDATFVRRFGEPGDLTILGGGFTYQKLMYPDDSVRVSYGGNYGERVPAGDSLAALVRSQMHTLDNARFMFVLGRRAIHWVRRGYDTMRGERDIPLGVQAELAVGPTLPGLSEEEDVLGLLSFYGAAMLGPTLVAGRLRASGRRGFGSSPGVPAWRDVLAEAELLAYWEPTFLPHQTLFFRAAGAGGWNARTPFQLTLGGIRALRGYDDDRFPGARRVTFTLEDRVYFGWPFPDVLDLGGTVFLDVGRIWPGEVPFGVDSGWRASAGFGLRGAFPAGSRTTYRVDIAFPLQAGVGLSDARLIISVGEVFGISTPFGGSQIARSRPASVSGGVLGFPE